MALETTLPEGAPDEVVTHALVRDVDLNAFGFPGTLALITLDNGEDKWFTCHGYRCGFTRRCFGNRGIEF